MRKRYEQHNTHSRVFIEVSKFSSRKLEPVVLAGCNILLIISENLIEDLLRKASVDLILFSLESKNEIRAS